MSRRDHPKRDGDGDLYRPLSRVCRERDRHGPVLNVHRKRGGFLSGQHLVRERQDPRLAGGGEVEVMDFKTVLSALLSKFAERGVRYALMGGFAMGLWGVGRTTVDLDFLVHGDDGNTIRQIMKDLGYACRYDSENVSQYVSPSKIFGEVDYLHAFRQASLEMLQRAEEKEIFEGAMRISVLRPEDLIGLKLQAVRNDSSRMEADVADIRLLISASQGKLDWELLDLYAEILKMEDLWQTIKKG
jgi:hypothetical protein